MTQPQDSDLEAGTHGTPSPEVSKTSDQPSSNGNSSEEALFEKFAKRLEPLIEKKVQSTKDKRFKTLEAFAPYLQAAGGDVKKAFREMRIDELTLGEEDGTPSTPEPQKVQVTDGQRATARILQEAGIDPADPEYVAMTKRQYTSETEWLGEVGSFAAKRAKATVSTPTPPTSLVNDAAGKTSANGNKEGQLNQLYAELEPLLGNPTVNKEKIRAIKDRIGKLG